MKKVKRLIYVFLVCILSVNQLSGCTAKETNNNYSTPSELIIKEESSIPTQWPKERLASPTPEPSIIPYVSADSKNIQIEEYRQEELEGVHIFDSVVSPKSSEEVDNSVVESLKTVPAASMVKVITANTATLAACFWAEEISPEVYSRMENNSFGENCTVPLENLRYIRVLHYGFDNEIYIGELVVNKLIADDIIDIFKELFDAKYPIERMVLIDNYKADDDISMEANNTSCFNFRLVEGTTQLSNHAYGLAVDINPLYNPQVKEEKGKIITLPQEAKEYADRNIDCAYYIKKDDVCYKAFISRGFTWGGEWNKNKDYQHFQKAFP